jgi:hypothetical protein
MRLSWNGAPRTAPGIALSADDTSALYVFNRGDVLKVGWDEDLVPAGTSLVELCGPQVTGAKGGYRPVSRTTGSRSSGAVASAEADARGDGQVGSRRRSRDPG